MTLSETSVAVSSNKVTDELNIIGIGASAGGLEALKLFFDNVPGNCSYSFVVIQHLSPDYKSLMADLLSKNTNLSIEVVKDKMAIEPGHVYLIPYQKNMTVKNGKLHLTDRPGSHDLNLPIDIFLSSLAKEKRENAVGIILSGTGSDGTRGIRAIKEVGGMVMVQSPEQAKFDGMPQSAKNTGMVDYILPVEQLPEKLTNFINHPKTKGEVDIKIVNDEQTLDLILNHIKNLNELDFIDYKRPTLIRRIARRMGINKINTLKEYYNYLSKNASEGQALYHDFLIGVTKFFRDLHAWDVLKQRVIPEIIEKNFTGNKPVRIWCVACSTGEEAYTIAILIKEEMAKQNKRLDVKIFATDIEDSYLAIASKGIYPESIVADLSPTQLHENFIRKGDKYQVTDSLRRMVIFSKHNVINNPPFNKMDLTVCRNMLIYIKASTQKKIMNVLHYSLNFKGYLMLGTSETVGDHKNVLVEIDRKARIYQNVEATRSLGIKSLNTTTQGFQPNISLVTQKAKAENQMGEVFNELLGEELGIATAYINHNHDILHATGEFKRYFELPEKIFSVNLLNMLPKTLSLPVSTAIRKAKKDKNKVVYQGIKYRKEGNLIEINVIVKPFKINPIAGKECFCVLFMENSITKTNSAIIKAEDEKGENDYKIKELEEELKDTRESLQATIEEVEVSSEELQATNEELLASQEELQSTKEELHSVNAELQQKIDDLAIVNADMDNLLKNAQVGTIFLDRELCIRKFTPVLQEQFKILDRDLGRPINHFSSNFGEKENKSLFINAIKVLKEGTPHYKEIKSITGKWFLERMFPFVNTSNKIDGVVISFVDITELKKIQQRFVSQNKAFKQILEGTMAGYWDWMIQEQTEYISPTFKAMLGYKDNEVPNTPGWWQQHIHPDDLQKINEAYQQHIASKGKIPYDTEIRYYHKNGNIIWVYSKGKVIEWDKKGNPVRMVGSNVNITPFKNALDKMRKNEENLKESKDLYEYLYEHAHEMYLSLRPKDGIILKCNETLCRKLDFTKEELLHHPVFKIYHPNCFEEASKAFKQFQKNGEIENVELILQRKDGQTIDVILNSNAVRNEKGEILYSRSSFLDITDKKKIALKEKLHAEELINKNKELEQFVYIASHDLQEPLNTITSFFRLLQKENSNELTDKGKIYINYIEQSTLRMRNLIKDLLDYSRIGRNKPKEILDCNRIVKEILTDLSSGISETGAKMEIATLPKIEGLETEIRLLFQNLITNAIKFRKKNIPPEVKIGAVKEKNYWKFSIEDNGIGLAKEYYNKIFILFQRLHASNEYSGTGVGLSHCKKIVELHNGKIWLESEPNKGSIFYFTIPIL